MQILRNFYQLRKLTFIQNKRYLTQSCTGKEADVLSNDVKLQIEKYWQTHIKEREFDPTQTQNKHYVLSMFPYPSGSLHMGHVRVYTISDAIARFSRMNGKNVFHPIGWDGFGLPAENAAIQRNIEPAEWTNQNIQQMKEQLKLLGCSFDWKHELATNDPNYFKWTQKLFLMLYADGLAYQNEALVNWDPVDETVLAHEQVDSDGRSWRSGAKVEKKPLNQWFIRTTAFAERLLDGLENPILSDWRDIINLQSHWIGPCNGYAFHLLTSASNYIRVWTENPEDFKDDNAFIVLKTSHYLAQSPEGGNLEVVNPFTGQIIPAVFSNEPKFPDQSDVYLAAPSFHEEDRQLEIKLDLNVDLNSPPTFDVNKFDHVKARADVLEMAQRLRAGGYRVSSKLQDWLISRQRYWGTPIPIIHCKKCGAVPVPEDDLPVELPEKPVKSSEPIICECPQCHRTDAERETDTMDTFVDSSWYYLRFLDPNNIGEIFDKKLVQECMPVDLYVGGKEHAVLHLYYARFMNQFLHSKGLVPTSEPFSRLLVQGMVMGRSYRVKNTGRYVREDEVEIKNAKKNQAVLKETKEPVIMSWEKMSKSKLNGVDPNEMFEQYGTDTTRLIILGDVAPTSHRNWTSATFPGILNWQKRLWLTMNDFYQARTAEPEANSVDTESADFQKEEDKLFDARNFYIKGATFNYKHSHQLSVAISKMQGLTNSLRRTPKHVVRYGKQYERALASQIIMLAPMAPYFASELWAKFIATPNRINVEEIAWDRDVLDQSWPLIDMEYKVDLSIKINGFEAGVIKIARQAIDKVTHNDAMDMAFSTPSVTSCLVDKKIRSTDFTLYPGIEAILHIHVDNVKGKEIESSKPDDEKVAHK